MEAVCFRRHGWVAVGVTLLFMGCGNARIQPPPLGTAPFDEATFLEGDAVVNFRVDQIDQFGTVRYDFHGSVRNNGPALDNARFEIVTTTRANLPGDGSEVKVVGVQNYGRMVSGATQSIAVSAEIVKFDNVQVTGRFVGVRLPQ